jgi:amino acid transporter
MLAMGINGVIGAGIFLAPATLARTTGAASTFTYLAASALVTLVALCFAEVGSRFDRAGGPFLYARTAFGPLSGFIVGWFTWLARMTSLAALANGFVVYCAYLAPGADRGAARAAILTLLIGGLTAINIFGVRQGSRTLNFLTVAKLAPLLFFALAGAAFLDPQRLRPESWPASGAFGGAVLFLFYVFGGFEVLTFPAEEVREPQRSIPRAVLLTQAVTLLVYVSVHLVTLGTLEDVAQASAPVASAARAFLGPAGGVLITAGAILSIAGCQSGILLTTPRLLFALARDGRLPRALEAVHPRWRTPHLAILTQGIVGLGLALWGTFEGMAVLSAVARIVTYVSTCLAVLALRRSAGRAPFTVAGGPLVPIAASLLCVWVAAQGDRATILWGAGAALIGLLLYLPGRRAPDARSES